MEYWRDEHRVHLVVYHLIWCPRRRRAFLTGTIATECKALIEQKCRERGWQILELVIEPDHIHLFVRVYPDVVAADVVKQCKGLTSRTLRQKHEILRRMPSMWTRSYFVSTAGNVSQSTIQKYIAAQKRV